MHIVIYGVGAIGGFFGASLQQSILEQKLNEHKISFLARAETLSVLQNQGISLERRNANKQETLKFPVNAYADLSEIKDPDVILVCVKSKDTLIVAEDIKNKTTERTQLVSIQNGIDNEDKLASVLGEDRVIGCLTNIAAQNLAPGYYSQSGDFNIIFGDPFRPKGVFERDLKTNNMNTLLKLFSAAAIKTIISSNIRQDLWKKLIWNAAFNPISALYEMTLGDLYANAEHRETIKGIMAEVIELANAEGLNLDTDLAVKQFDRTNVAEWADFKTSMLQDIQRGRPIELEELLGIVISKAQQNSLSTPYSSSVYDALRAKIAYNS